MADGDNVVLGQQNDATNPTVVSATGPWGLVSRAEQIGLFGSPTLPNGWGVFGTAGDRGVAVLGMCDNLGVVGTQLAAPGGEGGAGVRGLGADGYGVEGYSSGSYGVVGSSQLGGGVYGYSPEGAAVYGVTNSRRGNAAGFWGRVVVVGDFVVFGSKSAAVPHPDGSHRLMYSMESPESWFEDFGTATLVRGRAKVKLDRDFSALVRTAGYHVFLTAEGDSKGLYVSRKSRAGFEVREQQGGTAKVRFSYRVVAKRKDVRAPRLAKMPMPARPKPPRVPVRPQPPKRPTTEASDRRAR